MPEQDLLIEIGTEELPPKALAQLSKSFEKEVSAGLSSAQLGFSSIDAFSTPRRLALIVKSLQSKQDNIIVEKLGPALKAAFNDNGDATKAAEGFARSCGVSVSELEQHDDGKVTKLFFSSSKPGLNTASLIPDIVSSALAKLPIPKRMRWGSSRVEFVRPVHWAILLFGSESIPATILGVDTDVYTYGHRFHHPDKIKLNDVSEYLVKLSDTGHVMPSFSARRDLIRNLIIEQGEMLNAIPVIDDDLLNEVTALVEWPVALTGQFDTKYLLVPQEALISSLKSHQKCFYLVDADNNIKANFITISNIQSTQPAVVIQGNEKVIGPRLADAAFFYEQDKQNSLASFRPKLKTVIFQHKLGTLFDKSERVEQLSDFIASSLGFDPVPCQRAAQLAKCDLLTRMVGEFPDLQGIMGSYYALNDNESPAVASALVEQYLPRFSGDTLPSSNEGIVLALAERFDTLIGLFGIGEPPTGSKDPFALRRSALGILRIILEHKLNLDLVAIINKSISFFTELSHSNNLDVQVLDFIFDRLRSLYTDKGVTAQTFLSVAAVRPTSPLDFDLRINAVSSFSQLAEAEALSSANKRVANILAKLDTLPSSEVTKNLLIEPAEVALSAQLDSLILLVEPLLEQGDYNTALKSISALRDPIYTFFDTVMVNTDDLPTRNNRLALLQKLRQLFLQIADISEL